MLALLFGGRLYLFKIIIWSSVLLLIFFKFITRKLFRYKSLTRVDKMSGEEFECYVASILGHNGFKDVALTGGSGDFGVDIVANYKKNRYAIQVKRYKALVGVAAVQEAFSGAKYYDADNALVITNSHFTDAAHKLAQSCGVILIDRNAFVTQNFYGCFNIN